jgi:hypothetical protein
MARNPLWLDTLRRFPADNAPMEAVRKPVDLAVYLRVAERFKKDRPELQWPVRAWVMVGTSAVLLCTARCLASHTAHPSLQPFRAFLGLRPHPVMELAGEVVSLTERGMAERDAYQLVLSRVQAKGESVKAAAAAVVRYVCCLSWIVAVAPSARLYHALFRAGPQAADTGAVRSSGVVAGAVKSELQGVLEAGTGTLGATLRAARGKGQ